MLLNFWDTVRDYIKNSFSIGSLITLFIGIFIGVLITFIVYAVLSLKKINKSQKENAIQENELDTKENEEKVKEIIANAIARYDDVAKGKTTTDKILDAREISTTLVNDIAKTYYPQSKHPLAELSVDEVILLDKYIVEKVEKIFDHKIIHKMKSVKIATLMNMYDKYSDIEKNKILKKAKKYNATGILSVLNTIKNVVNPAYWGNKILINATVDIGVNKIIRIIIEIIGGETAKVYSKKTFNVDEGKLNDEIELAAMEVEQLTNAEDNSKE